LTKISSWTVFSSDKKDMALGKSQTDLFQHSRHAEPAADYFSNCLQTSVACLFGERIGDRVEKGQQPLRACRGHPEVYDSCHRLQPLFFAAELHILLHRGPRFRGVSSASRGPESMLVCKKSQMAAGPRKYGTHGTRRLNFVGAVSSLYGT
jgi:hypothetical protein